MTKQLLKVLLVLMCLEFALSGCSTGQNSQNGTAPTISGYISVGAAKSSH
jgi:hypothetical protein